MNVDVPSFFYRNAIKKFARYSYEPAALPALLVFVVQAEEDQNSLKQAISALDDDNAIKALIDKIQEDVPPDIINVFQRNKKEIYRDIDLRAQQKKARSCALLENDETQSSLDKVISMLYEQKVESDKAYIKADKRGEKIEELYREIETLNKKANEQEKARVDADKKAEERGKKIDELNSQIAKLNEKYDKEREAREKAEKKLKNTRILRGISYAIGVLGSIASIISFGPWVLNYFSSKSTEPPKTSEDTHIEQKLGEVENPAADKVKEMSSPEESSGTSPSEQRPEAKNPSALPSQDQKKAKGDLSSLFRDNSQKLSGPHDTSKVAYLQNIPRARRPVQWAHLRRCSFTHAAPTGRA